MRSARWFANCSLAHRGLHLPRQLAVFILGVIMPGSELHECYSPCARQDGRAGRMFVLVVGLGMIVFGWTVDRLGRRKLLNKLRMPAVYATLACALRQWRTSMPTSSEHRAGRDRERPRRNGTLGRGARATARVGSRLDRGLPSDDDQSRGGAESCHRSSSNSSV